MISDQKTANWSRIQSLFDQALQLPEDARTGFLRESCGDDQVVAEEVRSLLQAYAAGEDELEVSPVRSVQIPEPQPAVLPRHAVDGYEILGEIHRGGQGVVYRALQLSTKREVALKFMLTGPFTGQDARRRFRREVELASQLSHPGIVPVFDSGEAHGQHYFVMEYIPGLPLDEYVAERKLTTVETLKLFTQVCDAVSHAHLKDVIHRDLKPSNILVTSDGQPHVLDFGLAKLRSPNDADTVPLSMTGQVMGTLAYMSPEHAAGQPNQVDMSSDVYALAVILYELLAKQLPYDLNSSLAENLSAIQRAEPQPLKMAGLRADSDIATIIHKALSKEKSRRYQDAGELGDDINRHLRGEAIDAKRDSRLYVFRKKMRQHIVQAVIGVTLLIGISMGVFMAQLGGSDPKISPPLRPLADDDQYSQVELETQLDAMRDIHERGDSASAMIAQLHERFGPLRERDFESSMTAERRADLRKMKALEEFFVGNPSTTAIQQYLTAEQQNRSPVPGAARTSGLVNDFVEGLLQLAFEEADSTDPKTDANPTYE